MPKLHVLDRIMIGINLLQTPFGSIQWHFVATHGSIVRWGSEARDHLPHWVAWQQ